MKFADDYYIMRIEPEWLVIWQSKHENSESESISKRVCKVSVFLMIRFTASKFD